MPTGQSKSGTERLTGGNKKRQPGSPTIDSGLETGDEGSVISDNYPSTSTQNMTNRVRPEVTGQDERGYVQTDAGKVAVRNTSANRSRKIPSP